MHQLHGLHNFRWLCVAIYSASPRLVWPGAFLLHLKICESMLQNVKGCRMASTAPPVHTQT